MKAAEVLAIAFGMYLASMKGAVGFRQPVPGKRSMIKGFIICLAVLFAQLAVLHIVDVRLYSQDARPTANTPMPAPREDEQES
ncbi:hypothetical protein HW452_09905 [Halomonas aquamarina]|uniref:Uncharacterized protein n=1 Tax=Vreelandella aquamarina TaxID=77097 RepID=A0ACC5VWD2_9GAMM|nr:hypothetical protein [Halomonas aquamarina]MBZ5487839.1 hypothetical protein [Halomonas aquamarina]